MLPSKNRLNLAHYDQKGKGVKVQDVDFVLVHSNKLGDLKAAVIVSKKVAKLAVDRNRIRRITTSALSKINKLNGELVVIVKNNINTENSTKIKKQLENLIKKIK